MADGVDYVKMPPWKIFLIQLLNIAGLGPIYGAILGALYGPVALVWIVFGCIFAGAVHDYFSGVSVRHDGESIPDVVGHHLGNGFKQFMRGFSVLLLILVGVVFFLGPAELLASLTGIDKQIWTVIIIAYYFLATLLPVDKIIGRIYPFFASGAHFYGRGPRCAIRGAVIQATRFSINLAEPESEGDAHLADNVHHHVLRGDQRVPPPRAPMMARCMRSERQCLLVFYGAMIGEALIALIWARRLGVYFCSTPGL